MRIYKIHEAKPQLFRLVGQVANGEPLVIAKAGKPLVNVMARDTPAPPQTQRFG
jgi:prevent-host-death family protein